jgi:hypothetical protein
MGLLATIIAVLHRWLARRPPPDPEAGEEDPENVYPLW